MKILFFGYQNWGYLSLKALIKSGKNVVGVITHKAKENEEWYHSVEKLSKENNIATFFYEKENELMIKKVKELNPNLILSIGYRNKIPSEVLSIPLKGAINVHGSLLPKYKGGAVLNWAIINGEKETGVTAHIMTNEFDSGDIVAQKKIMIKFEDEVIDVYNRALPLYPQITIELVRKIEEGTLIRTPQDQSKTIKVKRRKPEDGLTEWNKSSLEIYNWVRALTHPYPGAFNYINNKKCFIWKVKMVPDEFPNYNNGEIVEIKEEGFIVKSQKGSILVTKAQFENEEEMNASNLFKDHNLNIGTKLETNKKNIVAIIPARGGSKGLLRKNIKNLAGYPLIYYTIKEAKKSKYIHSIFVSTDDEEIAAISNQDGTEVIKRPEELSSDESLTIDALKHAVNYIEKEKGIECHYIVTLQPTSPLRTVEDIDLCIKKIIESNCQSVTSISKVLHNPFTMVTLNEDKTEFFIEKPKTSNRQGQPSIYQINGAVYVIKRNALFKEEKYIVTDDNRSIIMLSEKSFDIDDIYDFNLVEQIILDKIK